MSRKCADEPLCVQFPKARALQWACVPYCYGLLQGKKTKTKSTTVDHLGQYLSFQKTDPPFVQNDTVQQRGTLGDGEAVDGTIWSFCHVWYHKLCGASLTYYLRKVV